MKTITKNIYTFKELLAMEKEKKVSSKVVQKAREWLQVLGYDWSQFTIEDFQNTLERIGFEDSEIQFSGFCSQGDGASFESKRIDVEKLVKFLGMNQDERNKYLGFEIKGLVMTDKFKRVAKLADIFSINTKRLTHHYSHENTVMIDIDFDYPDGHSKLDKLLNKFREYVEDLRKDLCKYIYRSLEKEYEYLMSDESLIESCESNDWRFDENGRFEHD